MVGKQETPFFDNFSNWIFIIILSHQIFIRDSNRFSIETLNRNLLSIMLPATYGLNLFLYREEEEETIFILKRKKIVHPQLRKAFFYNKELKWTV